jgi:hypothetical protein
VELEEMSDTKGTPEFSPEAVSAVKKFVGALAEKYPKKSGESNESWGARIRDAAEKGALKGVRTTMLGPIGWVADDLAVRIGKSLASGVGDYFGGEGGAEMAAAVVDAADKLTRPEINEAHEGALGEMEAATLIGRAERGPTATRALADYEDPTYCCVPSIVDVIEGDFEDLLEAVSRVGLSGGELEELEAFESGYTSVRDLSPRVRDRVEGEQARTSRLPPKGERSASSVARRPMRSPPSEPDRDRSSLRKYDFQPKIPGVVPKAESSALDLKKFVTVDKDGTVRCNGFKMPEYPGKFVGQVASPWNPSVFLGRYMKFPIPGTDRIGKKRILHKLDWHAWEWNGHKWVPNPFNQERYESENTG